MKPITHDTPITIALLIVILAGAGTVFYTAFQTRANAKDIETLQKKQDSISTIQTDVAVIREKIESIEKRLPRK